MINEIGFILLHTTLRNEPLGERVFIGALSALLLCFIFSYIGKRNNKKEEKRAQEIENEQIRKASISKENEYYDILKEIAENSGEELHFNYSATISQLLEKCNPKHFIDKNDYGKLEIATSIYSELISLPKNFDKEKVRRLRKRANERLGVMLSSEETFQILERVFNPQKFIDENFNAPKLLACSKAHEYIMLHRHDLRKLDQFAYKIDFLKL